MINPKTLGNSIQHKVLSEIFDSIQKDSRIITLGVRGSIAKGISDQCSDIDFFIITKNESFEEIAFFLEQLLPKSLVLLTKKGWIDSNVPNFGGIGYVYMILFHGKLLQLDAYVLPEENAERIIKLKDKKLFSDVTIRFKSDVNLQNHRFTESIKDFSCKESIKFQEFFDILLHFEMLSKYIARKNPFLAYKYWYLLNSKVWGWFRNLLDPSTQDYMYYDVHRQLDGLDSPLVTDFEKHLTLLTGVFDSQSLISMYKYYRSVLKEYEPELYMTNKDLIDRVYEYMTSII